MVKARKDDVVENFHGTKVADPYRWLEDPESEETKAWVQSIGEKCRAYFESTTTREEDETRLKELFDYSKLSVPKMVENRLFYLRNDGLQNQAVLYMKENDEEKILIDPNKLSEDGTTAMSNYFISHDGRKVAYAISKHGSDWQEILVRDVDAGEDLSDHIKHVKFTNVAWLPDNSGFYYSRFPDPATVSEEDDGNYNKIYLHKLGTPQSDDELIYERPDYKELMFMPMISDDDKYLVIHAAHGTATENRVYVMSLDGSNEVLRLLDDADASYRYITNDGENFYFITNLHADNSRIIKVPLYGETRDEWEEIIPEQEDVIHFSTFINGKFIIAYLHDAHHQLQMFDQNGNHEQEINLSHIGSIVGMTKNEDDNKLYFAMMSYLEPTTIYEFNVEEKEMSIIEKVNLPIDVSQFETKQIFYTSKDGTKVPMFVTHHKDIELDGENPVILYGYGGFNISVTPTFNPAILRWLEKGGVYAVANLRGGTEYGEQWHREGMLENKQNVFDDFIAAGEWLIENDYTKQDKLAIMGGSNGGLLVAACMVQRPDLFGAVLCLVPVIDMLRYHKFTIGKFWVSEYGDPDTPEHFEFLYKYSPLHNVEEGVTYPPILIATAESDDRVVPAHAKKFAATLYEKASEDSTVILRLEPKAGHGHGKPIEKTILEWVDYFAFLDKELSM
ncbi:MAG TPA: prolyl oligopeptidase family serine peptidase [Bacillota bacterium]|nr:prolyl oligopeptidase family serine peptidase [Bacillota bacterium]